MAQAKLSIQKGDPKKGTPDELHIRIPMDPNPKFSSSGKTKNLASTNGFQVSDLDWDGYPIKISVNAVFKDESCK